MGQLDHELRLRLVGELGIRDFVAPCAQSRRLLDSAKEVCIAHEGALKERRLENDVDPCGHGSARRGDVLGEAAGA